MKVNTYEEWKQAVNAEYEKLQAVRYYLNEKGEERLRAFGTIRSLSDYCEAPQELLAWIESKDGMDRHDAESVNSSQIFLAINALRRIAKGG